MRQLFRLITGGVISGMVLGTLHAGQTLNLGNNVSIVDGVTIINGKTVSGSQAGHVQGSGKMAEEERALTAFTDIEIAISADVSITQGDKHLARLQGDANILPHITTKVSGGLMRISAEKGFSTQSDLRLEIVTPHLNKLIADASGNVVIEGLQESALELRLGGSGNITASGQVDRLKASLDGAGDMQLFGLKANSADVRLDGSGDLRVHATTDFSGELDGSGDILLRGNPRIKKANVRGAGEIVKD